jgi:cytochrome o ubiquinol oxidase subunit 3
MAKSGNHIVSAPSQHGGGHAHEGHHDLEGMRLMGFWIFLITDCILFGTLFATYVVLSGNTAGGPTGAELFEMPGVIAETFILLTSSFTSGLAVLAMNRGDRKGLISWLAVHEGATISTSAHWSAFYTLVGTHGLHVSLGLVWMIAIMIQLGRHGINSVTRRKVNVISLYWHFLDVVWIFVFTIVYLLEVM